MSSLADRTLLPLSRCGRCGYRGDSVSYFRRPVHAALLAGAALVGYGLGGAIYWWIKREDRICPNCGAPWGEEIPLATPGVAAERGIMHRPPPPDPPLPRTGAMRRVLGIGSLLLGLFLALTILFGATPVPLLALVLSLGAVGTTLFLSGQNALAARRRELQARVHRRVLLLAEERGGELTVSDVAANLSLTLAGAERILMTMDDGLRVRSEVTREGVILYEFPELMPRYRALPERGGTPAAESEPG